MELLNFQRDLIKKTEDHDPENMFISIFLDENNAFIIKLENVLKIGTTDFLSKIGICHEWFLGIVNIQNNVVPLISLTKSLNINEKNNKELLLLNQGFAISCYKVENIISKDDLVEMTSLNKDLPFIDNEYIHKNGTIYKEININKMIVFFDFKNIFKSF